MGVSAPLDSLLRAARRPLGVALLALACSSPEETEQVDRASVQTALDAYAPRLGIAYSVADLDGLKRYAEENAIEDQRVLELLEHQGQLAALPLRERLETALQGLAVEKEIAGLEKRIGDLLAEGRAIRPSPDSVVVENVETWRHTNAFATTVEVWDLRVYAAGTDVLLSETLDQRNRVKYQLQRQGDTWIVLFRELEATFE